MGLTKRQIRAHDRAMAADLAWHRARQIHRHAFPRRLLALKAARDLALARWDRILASRPD